MHPPRAKTGQGALASHRPPWTPFLILLAIAAAIMLVSDIDSAVTMVLAGTSLFVALAGAIQSVTSGLRPVAAGFYTFWFAWLGVGPAIQLTLGRVAWRDDRALTDPSLVRAALLLNCGALLAFWAGDRTARWRATTTPLSAPSVGLVRRSGLSLLTVATVVVGINAIQKLGLTTFFTTRQQRADALRAMGIALEGSGGAAYALYTILPAALSISLLLLGVLAVRRIWSGFAHIKISDLAAVTVGGLGCIIFANPFTQTRFITLTAVGSVLLALLAPRSTRAGLVYLTIGLIATLLVYPLADAFRHGWSTIRSLATETFVSADFDGFQQVINTVRFVGTYGHSDGGYTLSSLLFFVPRSMWEGKATPASLDIAQSAGYSFVNLSLPLHAELFLDFGVVGMVLCMFALGFGIARMDHAWLTATDSRLAMLVPFAAVAIVGLLRGPLGSMVPAFMPVVILVAAFSTVESKRQEKPAGRGGGSTSDMPLRSPREAAHRSRLINLESPGTRRPSPQPLLEMGNSASEQGRQ